MLNKENNFKLSATSLLILFIGKFMFVLFPAALSHEAIHPQELPKGHSLIVSSGQFIPNWKFVLSPSLERSENIRDTKSFPHMHCMEVFHNELGKAFYNMADKKELASAFVDRTAISEVYESGPFQYSSMEHGTSSLTGNEIISNRFSKNWKRILTLGRCRIPEVRSKGGRMLRHLNEDTVSDRDAGVKNAVFCPKGRRVLTAGPGNTATIWDSKRPYFSKKGKLLHSLEGHNDIVSVAVFSADGHKVLTASSDGTARIWDAESGQLLINLEGHTAYIRSAVFSADGHKVLTASSDSTAKIWDAASGQFLINLVGHSSFVHSAVFSADGQKVLTASFDNTAKIWDSESGQLLINLEEHKSVSSAVFSADGQKVLTTAYGQQVKIWDAENGQLLINLEENGSYFTSAVFSADGKKVLATGFNYTVGIWDSKSGKLLHILDIRSPRVNCPVSNAAFSANGKKVMVVSRCDSAKIWNIKSGRLLQNRDRSKIIEIQFFGPRQMGGFFGAYRQPCY